MRGIHWWPVNSSNKGQWPGALIFSLIYTRTNGWINTRDAIDWRRHRVGIKANKVLMTGQINCVCYISSIHYLENYSTIAANSKQWKYYNFLDGLQVDIAFPLCQWQFITLADDIAECILYIHRKIHKIFRCSVSQRFIDLRVTQCLHKCNAWLWRSTHTTHNKNHYCDVTQTWWSPKSLATRLFFLNQRWHHLLADTQMKRPSKTRMSMCLV